MTNKFQAFLIVIVTTTFLFIGSCKAPTFTTVYDKRPQIVLYKNMPSSQTVGDITIDLSPVDIEKEYQKPLFNRVFEVKKKAIIGSDIVTEKHDGIIYFYNKLGAFNVTIHNNTDHIIRMNDSRIAYIDPQIDEPIFALDKQYIIRNIKRVIPTYQITIDDILMKYPLTNENDLAFDKSLIDIVEQIRFINISEILPGMRASGTIIFPVDPVDLSQGVISFIDMVSKTDPAGNPVERVRFDFKTDVFSRYYMFDPNLNEWTEINENEYLKGQTKPQNYVYDRKIKKWVVSN